jgi:hypothetical protein
LATSARRAPSARWSNAALSPSVKLPRQKLGALRKKLSFAEVGRIVRGKGIQLTELGQPRPLPRRAGFDHLK